MSDEEDDDGADEDIPRKSDTGISGDGVRGRRDMRHSAVPVPTAVPRDEITLRSQMGRRIARCRIGARARTHDACVMASKTARSERVDVLVRLELVRFEPDGAEDRREQEGVRVWLKQ